MVWSAKRRFMSCAVARGHPHTGRRPHGPALAGTFQARQAIIEEFKPDEVAVEKLFLPHVTTAISVGQAFGAILLSAALAGVPIVEYTPAGGQAGRCQLRQCRQTAGADNGHASPPA